MELDRKLVMKDLKPILLSFMPVIYISVQTWSYAQIIKCPYFLPLQKLPF